MKKLVALLMALVLALSCTAAFAEEAAAPTGTMTVLSVALDENYVKAMAGAMDPDGSLGDFWVLNVLRSYADGIIVGANTLA